MNWGKNLHFFFGWLYNSSKSMLTERKPCVRTKVQAKESTVSPSIFHEIVSIETIQAFFHVCGSQIHTKKVYCQSQSLYLGWSPIMYTWCFYWFPSVPAARAWLVVGNCNSCLSSAALLSSKDVFLHKLNWRFTGMKWQQPTRNIKFGGSLEIRRI